MKSVRAFLRRLLRISEDMRSFRCELVYRGGLIQCVSVLNLSRVHFMSLSLKPPPSA